MVPKLEILILGNISDSSSDKIPSGGLECYALGASMIRKVSFLKKKKKSGEKCGKYKIV
jgi:hypothetical protein